MRDKLAGGYRSLAAMLVTTAITCAGGAIGCANSSPTTEPADAALKDPMNYTPSMPNTDTNFSNGDPKAIGKDINDLLIP